MTPWSSLSVISPRTAFNSGVSPLKYFFSDHLVPPSFPRLDFPLLFPLYALPLLLLVGVGVADADVDGVVVVGSAGSSVSFVFISL